MVSISETLIAELRSADLVTVLTGAGISKESGLSTFRDPDGHWSKIPPEKLATMRAFRQDPVLVQTWYNQRIRQAGDVSPNPAHLALVELEKASRDFLLITQNVDDLHNVAGSRNVVEVHGNIKVSYCADCGSDAAIPLGEADAFPHRCDTCGGLIRPGVVWFGEQLPAGAVDRAIEATESCDVFLSVGTSGVVYPVAGLPELARRSGAYTVEINVEPSAVSAVMNEVLIGEAGTVVPALVDKALASL